MTDQPNAEIELSIPTCSIVTNYHDLDSGEPVLLRHSSGPGVSAWANWSLTLQAPDLAVFGFS